MKRSVFAFAAAAVTLPNGLSGSALAQQLHPSCTDSSRQCMIAAATGFLDGLTHHDGSKVPFAAVVRFTEQGKGGERSDADMRKGLDGEMPMLGYRNTRFVVDERKHEIVYYTLLDIDFDQARAEKYHLQPGLMTVHQAERFKIEKGLITEVENLFYAVQGKTKAESGWPDE